MLVVSPKRRGMTSLILVTILLGGLTSSLLPPKDITETATSKSAPGLGTTVVEARVIWKPHIVDSRVHHVLEGHSVLKYPFVVASILYACLLPRVTVEMMKFSDNQVTQLSKSSQYMVSNNFFLF